MKLFFTLLALLVFLTGFSLFKKPTASDLVHETTNKVVTRLQKKYLLDAIGEGSTMPDGIIQQLAISFMTRKAFTRDELRYLLVQCAQDYLDEINRTEAIQPYLVQRPFKIENVVVTIFNNDRDGSDIYAPGISVANISRGILEFVTVDPGMFHGYKDEFEETYEEALKLTSKQILNKSPS